MLRKVDHVGMTNDLSTHTSAVSAAPTGDHEWLALDATTLCEAFQVTARRFADQVALRTPGDGVRLSWREYAERVRRLAGGLHAAGVRPGETVATMLVNRPEALLVDTAAMHLG